MSLTTFRNREVQPGQHVRVYYNVHKGLFSIQDPQTRVILGHSPTVVLDEAKFVVYEKGRQKVKRTKQKNVHAFVVGRFAGTEAPGGEEFRAGTYNPHFNKTFIDAETKAPLTGLYPTVVCEGKAVRYREPRSA